MTPSAEAAELAATYLLERAIEQRGTRHYQGMRSPELPCRVANGNVARFARERFHRVPTLAAQALVAWADGFPVELLTNVPDASHVLELQAIGARCVSLLPESAATAPHASRLEFVLHDLCHLGKFACSPHYAEQVGFFSTLKTAFADPRWHRLESELDDTFRRDREHVSSDMNGSCVFLFAVFKMKLKMAARRLHARACNMPPPSRGPLSGGELETFREVFGVALDAMGLEGPVREAAVVTSARRDAPEMAEILADHFGRRGRVILSRGAAYYWGSDAKPD